MLVAAALELMRQPQVELNRKQLAITAGVTPALVTYYFQDQKTLFDAVVQPVIEGYLAELKSIVSGSDQIDQRLRSLVVLLIRISRNDGRLLDGYITFAKQNPKSQLEFLASAYQELSKFFVQCEEQNYFRKSAIPFSQTILWGACKIVAQTSELSTLMFGTALSESEIEEKQATLIIDLLLHGLGQPSAG